MGVNDTVSADFADAVVVQLAIAQLRAYNAHDLDAFCACYHADVRVLDADGAEELRGLQAFRTRYQAMFERGGFGASIDQRVVSPPHCVEREHWWRINRETAERADGVVLVRYSEREGLIGVVQFLR